MEPGEVIGTPRWLCFLPFEPLLPITVCCSRPISLPQRAVPLSVCLRVVSREDIVLLIQSNRFQESALFLIDICQASARAGWRVRFHVDAGLILLHRLLVFAGGEKGRTQH